MTMERQSGAGTITALRLSELADLMRELGYRAEQVTDEVGQPVLRSASNGVGFNLRPGNLGQGGETFIDFTLFCVVRVPSSPAAAIEEWNRTKRFARMHGTGDLLALEMDVVAAGGVSRSWLRAHFEIWDQLINELMRFLRRLFPVPEAQSPT